jgi:histone H3/H4
MAKRAAKKKAKKTGRSTGRKRAPQAEMLLVGSKVKQALRAHDVNVASDAADSLNYVVHWYINQAAKRAAANGRKTVRAHDFMIG